MRRHPNVFISHASESEEHYVWVRQSAAQLRLDGIGVEIDEWDLIRGNRPPLFMEATIADTDYVLVI